MAKNKRVLAEVKKSMYGLPQAGKQAHNKLAKHLKPCGFEEKTLTPGLWQNKTTGLKFTLVVDDFGVEYTNVKHVLNFHGH